MLKFVNFEDFSILRMTYKFFQMEETFFHAELSIYISYNIRWEKIHQVSYWYVEQSFDLIDVNLHTS